MPRERGRKPGQGRIKAHELAVIKVNDIAHELGYEIELSQERPGPGPDLIVRNPKNNRTAVIEIELSYASQIQTRQKFGTRWREVKASKDDRILLVFGVTRYLLERDLGREPANVPDALEQFGIRVFSSPSAEEKSQIQASLLRCLGDE